ncbi:MAG: holo-ACP synthase [bacterium]
METALTRLESALRGAVVAAINTDNMNGIGADIVPVERVRRMRNRNANAFESLAFTPAEVSYCRHKHDTDLHFAGVLAAKEAVYKALGLNWDMAFSWRFMEVRHRSNGSPYMTLTDVGSEALPAATLGHVSLSIAHAGDYAIAVAWAPSSVSSGIS